jgi:putative sigma-54 modulation protein
MKLTITGRHLTVPEADRTELRRKLRSLERVLNSNAVSATVVVARERQAIACDLTVHARGGHMLHAEGRHALISGAVAAAVAKLTPQAKRLVDRWKSKRRDRSTQITEPPPSAPTLPPVTVPKVIRNRGYAARAMTVADAALELAGSEAQVLVFRHAVSENVAVIFRRPDGAFGLIETTNA